MAIRFKKGWLRFGAGVAMLVGIVLGRGGAGLLAQNVITGRNIDVNGKYTCDCLHNDKNCICIVPGS
jgi:hypothetical protein